jgi:DmsE family decaheme c-type cytochrome
MKLLRLVFLLAVQSCLIATAAMAQAVKVNEPEVCFACHSDLQDLNAKKHVHTAFKVGKCSSCHNPHASKHATLLNDDAGKLCLSCHKVIKKDITRVSSHQPAAAGDCLTCHDPHASDFPNQLKQATAGLCTTCHPAVTEWMKRAVIHQPVAGKQCMTCHKPHGSDNAHLTTSAVPTLCFQCHKQDQAFQTVHKGYNLSNADCTTCHDPHSSSNKGLLMANQHPPFKAGRCADCHGALAQSGGSFAIQGSVSTLCLKCHNAIATNLKKEFHGHIAGDSSCVNCHNPHASNVSTLLASDQKTLCMKCHFNDMPVKDKTHYITHKDIDCTSCHAPHGANNERLFKDEDWALCKSCHPDAHKGSHPMGPEVINKITNKPVTCISCHKLHGSDYPKYLPLNPDGDLCVQCHKK